jgi:colanic acid biosynthesis glycosyl transferase WcaI
VKRERKTIVIISQVYVPDPAATGQHLADVAEELVRRGNKVIVYTSSRGYDEPSIKYPLRETINGVLVRRVPLSSFGKSSILVRLAGGFSFVAQSVVRAIASRKIDAVLISTSPPLAPVAALTLGALRGAKVKYWVMDINPDQIVALGMASPTSTSVRAFDWLNRRILSRANNVVVLDRLMAARINAKVPVGERLSVLPPWPAEDPLDVVQHEENPFRREHVPPGKLVLMYSGNHGPSNPLTTILQAAKRLENDDRLLFMFVGGGVGKKEVDETTSSNIVSLPYQPMAELRNSLSAADVHIVTVGDAVAGIVHPSKVYGAMAVGRPILLVGPPENHVADILAEHDIGWHVQHGDVDAAVRILREIASMPRSDLVAKGMLARSVMTARGGKAGSVARMADVVEE